MTIYRPYNLCELFPDCVLPDCPDTLSSGKQHQHILPHQQAILDCDTKYLYTQGGVGSAKSLAFAAKCVDLCMTIPNNTGIVSRRDYKLLYRSSWREVKACVKRLVDKEYIDFDFYKKHMYTDKQQGDYSVIHFPDGSILYAIQGKNLTEALGPSYGFFWVDDAQETLEEFFIGDNTSAGLLSRLREPHVHYDTRTYDAVTRPHGSLHGMVSSNPPPYGSWLHRLFGNKPGIHHIGDDTVTWMEVSTDDNPFVGADYAKGLISIQQRMGHNANTIQRIIYGKSVPAYAGIPVFPQFDTKKHVASLRFKPELPLLRSWDFGHDHPAVTFSNIFKCKYNTNHYFTLSEIAEAFNLTVYKLYDEYVKPHTDMFYKDAKLILNCGDRAGMRFSSANKDRRSDMKILIEEYKIPFKWRYINLAPSLQYMRGLLQPRHQCKCGLPLVLISNKCPVLIGALQGGYRLPKPRNGPVGDKPVEDKYFADVACAWRYGAENFIKWGVEHRDMVDLQQQVTSEQRQQLTPFSWMDKVPFVTVSVNDR